MASNKPSPFAITLADFSLNLYRQIGSDDESSTIFLSPLLISVALAMTYAGAAGNTKKQLESVLFGNLVKTYTTDEMHSLFAQMIESISKNDNTYQLYLANRIFVHEPTIGDIWESFQKILKKYYSGDLQPLNFLKQKGEPARKIINDWVSEKTNQKIKDLLPKGVITPLIRLILVNAVSFKAEWKRKFDKRATMPVSFYVGPEKEIQVLMMEANYKEFYYNENRQLQTLGMPYLGQDVFMFVLLPKKRGGLKVLEKSMSGEKLLQIFSETRECTIDLVRIPKFKAETTVNMKETLKTLGATDMFNDQKADFSYINGKTIATDQEGLVVSDLHHKAYIEVNEDGTEATAAVAMGLRGGAGPPALQFVADKPFLYAIVDMKSNNILFLGRYYGGSESVDVKAFWANMRELRGS